MQTALYCRQVPDNYLSHSRLSLSIYEQEIALYAYAQKKALLVYAVYVDNAFLAGNRPAFSRMCTDISRGYFNTICAVSPLYLGSENCIPKLSAIYFLSARQSV